MSETAPIKTKKQLGDEARRSKEKLQRETARENEKLKEQLAALQTEASIQAAAEHYPEPAPLVDVAKAIADGIAQALAAQEADMHTVHAQTTPSRPMEPIGDKDDRFPDGFHDVVVQKSNPNYSSPLARMLNRRSYFDPKKRLYTQVLDGATDEGMARLDHEDLVVLRMGLPDYQHLLETNDSDARGIESVVASDEDLKRVPLAL